MTARRFKDLTEFMAVDLGGADRLSQGELQLIRRAALLSAQSEKLEAEWSRGEGFDLLAYCTATNALRRVLECLGLERRQRDVSPTLERYLADKAKATE